MVTLAKISLVSMLAIAVSLQTCHGEGMPCLSDPCQNKAECENGQNGYTCVCAAGYGGVQCQTKLMGRARGDACSNNPCPSNLTCTASGGTYRCSCNDHQLWNGTDCVEPFVVFATRNYFAARQLCLDNFLRIIDERDMFDGSPLSRELVRTSTSPFIYSPLAGEGLCSIYQNGVVVKQQNCSAMRPAICSRNFTGPLTECWVPFHYDLVPSSQNVTHAQAQSICSINFGRTLATYDSTLEGLYLCVFGRLEDAFRRAHVADVNLWSATCNSTSCRYWKVTREPSLISSLVGSSPPSASISRLTLCQKATGPSGRR